MFERIDKKKIPDFVLPVFLTFLSLAITIIYNSRFTEIVEDKLVLEEVVEEVPVINYLYQIPADSFRIETGKVKNNQTFSGLLSNLGITNETINNSLNLSSEFFDARKFISGNTYAVFYPSDSIDTVAYFIYEKDPVEYVVFQFLDSIAVWPGIKDIDTIRQSFTGNIETSLWNSFTSAGANPMVAIELSEIYAWSIDFFGLQYGDSFKIVYDEYFVEGVPYGIGNVYGAYFKHAGTEFWAIPFIQDERIEFFDENGNSLRKAFLKAPLRYARISSRFSGSRLHPILRVRRPHHGVDYSAPVGTPVVTVGDGVVTKAGYDGGSGNMVRIKHNSTYSTSYLHLSRFGPGIKNGVYVKQGDIIGYVGSTGLSTGPHLDFRFFKNGQPVNPLTIDAPPVEPVNAENLDKFNIKKMEVIEMLESL